MQYKVVSCRLTGFGNDQTQQFDRVVQDFVDEGWKPKGGVSVTQLPNGYQVTQALVKDGSE